MSDKYVFNIEKELEDNPLAPGETMRLRFLKHCPHSGANVAQAKEVMPHYHKDHDEYVYILRGNHEFRVGDEKVQVGPGDLVIAPAGLPHWPSRVGPGYAALSIYAPDWDESQPDRVPMDP